MKKLLLAESAAAVANAVYALAPEQLGMGLAWLGAVSYCLQIFFDFSGYSDMAIGIGMLFGFEFPENFNYPYVSGSVSEFWRRWLRRLPLYPARRQPPREMEDGAK